MSSSDNTYRIIEIVGSSTNSIEDAIKTGLARTSETVKHLRWFEVTETRGHIEDGKIAHYQVGMKVGFTVE
mgnify:CR=1 FL=1|jgi:dodecin